MIRPAPTAVSQLASDMPPMSASRRASEPYPQQPQVENEYGTKPRRDTEDMNHVDHGIGPWAGVAHERAERRRLQPGERVRHARALSTGLGPVRPAAGPEVIPQTITGTSLDFA